jgi:sodium/potassium-transporting ATPase subunit beta
LRTAKNAGDDASVKRSELQVKGSDLTNGEGMVVLSCKGETAADEEYLGPIEYWPFQGFPVEYFPYTNQKGYLSPFVFIKLNRPKKGTVINIECTAHARNIAIKRVDREGNLRFELLIDE